MVIFAPVDQFKDITVSQTNILYLPSPSIIDMT